MMYPTSHERLNVQSRSLQAARLTSTVLSPPLVSAILGFVLALDALPTWPGLAWGAAYGFLVSLVPVLYVLHLLRQGRVADMHMSDQRQRRVPYLIGVLGAGAAYLALSAYGGPPLLVSLAVATGLLLAALGLINFFWLISSHMAGISMAATFVGCVYGAVAGVALTPLVGLVFYARWILQRHTVLQLFAGLAVGGASVWVLGLAGVLPPVW